MACRQFKNVILYEFRQFVTLHMCLYVVWQKKENEQNVWCRQSEQEGSRTEHVKGVFVFFSVRMLWQQLRKVNMQFFLRDFYLGKIKLKSFKENNK